MAQIKPLGTKHWLALLAALFTIVLIAHLTIISSARGQFNTIKSAPTEVFTTRMIELAWTRPSVENLPTVLVAPMPVKPKLKAVTTPQTASSQVTPASPPTAPLTATPTPTPTTTQSATQDVAQVVTETTPTLLPTTIESVPTQTKAWGELVSTQPEMPASFSGATEESGQPPPAFTAPASAKHSYKVIVSQKGGIYQGKAEALLQKDGQKYALSLSASQLLYSITWTSAGLMSPRGFMPVRFSDKRTFKSEVAAHFDWQLGKIIFSSNTPQAKLEAGAQDRISIIWQLSGLLAADPGRYPPGSTLSIQTADDREAQNWLFTVNEPEILSLENGSQMALRLTRNPRREFDRKIELWFAPALAYLPVRFRQTQTNGDYEDMVWQSTSSLP